MLDFIRIAAAVPPLSLGNTDANCRGVIEKLREADKKASDIVVFPELAVTGYSLGDLFFQKELAEGVKNALSRIVEETSVLRCTAVFGLPLVIEGQLYNCAAVASGGRLRGIVPKTFLPDYNEFYEKRWFTSSQCLSITELSAMELGLTEDYSVSVGADLIFSAGGAAFGIEICEDLWAPLPPGTFLALNGAEIMLNLSASNETISKNAYREELVKGQSARTLSAYVYVSSGMGESTTDLVYSGRTVICENGTVLAENEKLIDGNYLLCADVDLGKIRSDRIQKTTFADSAQLYGKLKPVRRVTCNRQKSASRGELYSVNKLPFVPPLKADRQKRCFDIFEMQAEGLRRRLEATGARPVLGISGGLDSTLALLVSADCMRRMGRPSSDTVGITMPCFGTTDRTYNNAIALMKALGVTSVEIPVKNACLQHAEDIGHPIDCHDVTFENIQARERTQVLMDYACRVNGLVVGTGDLSELALGWCTYNADHMSMYGVNAGVPKTLVRWMILSLAESETFAPCADILRDIADTPISPELLPPDENGAIAQETESIVGPYALHDFFLYYTVRFGFTPEKIFCLAETAFKAEFDGGEILKWLKVFYKRFFSQQFKRSCLPDGVKIGSLCLSPRGDWRMPSDACAQMWLDAVDSIKI